VPLPKGSALRERVRKRIPCSHVFFSNDAHESLAYGTERKSIIPKHTEVFPRCVVLNNQRLPSIHHARTDVRMAIVFTKKLHFQHFQFVFYTERARAE